VAKALDPVATRAAHQPRASTAQLEPTGWTDKPTGGSLRRTKMARAIVVLLALMAATAVAVPAAAKDKKVHHSDIVVTKKMDSSSPMLMERKKGGGKQLELMEFKMKSVTIMSSQTGPSGGVHNTIPLTATSSGLLEGGGGTVGGGGTTRVRHTAPSGQTVH
jgi:uncharacterized membrane protein YgcG